MTTTSTYDPAVPYVENDYEEGCDTAMRVHLGLRPTFYDDDDTAPHPDTTSICPTWCYVRTDPDWDHEKTAVNPMSAGHSGPDVTTVASLYIGDHSPGADGERSYINTATLRSHLHQQGCETPTISVALYCSDNPAAGRRPRRELTQQLRLTVEDARELAIALNHLVGLADHG